MNSKRHLLVIDPTAYAGGSKIATENILKLLNNEQMRITVLSADQHSWNWPQLKRLKLYQPKWLAQRDQGIPYFLRHLFIALNIFIIRLRFGKIDIALGASGPGVDLSLYLIKSILGFQIVQLIHGPVASSRTIGRCLRAANEVHYLESSQDSLLSALSRVTETDQKLIPENFHIMQNGLAEQAWPSRCQTERPVVFWAASLLKWKGLETLIGALQHMDARTRPETHICYIRPEETPLPVSQAPVAIDNVYWHENPEYLENLRSGANIFVSTSRNEPFGLSILEAMAAGHCVLIPSDGAYWDRTLKNGVNCIKYRPDAVQDLANILLSLSRDMNLVRTVGAAAARLALDYKAQTRYAHIKNTLQGTSSISGSHDSDRADTPVTP